MHEGNLLHSVCVCKISLDGFETLVVLFEAEAAVRSSFCSIAKELDHVPLHRKLEGVILDDKNLRQPESTALSFD